MTSWIKTVPSLRTIVASLFLLPALILGSAMSPPPADANCTCNLPADEVCPAAYGSCAFQSTACQYSDAITCNGRGTVSDTGQCTCDSGYDGSTCQYSSAVTCNGNGNVTATGQCNCFAGFVGADCARCAPDLYGATCTQRCPGGIGNACSGHGTCDDGLAGSGTCSCLPGFTGPDCATAAPQAPTGSIRSLVLLTALLMFVGGAVTMRRRRAWSASRPRRPCPVALARPARPAVGTPEA
ncbi:MAG: hypothetical protein R3F35_20835 [Myxococcota bacterium]